jgi:hypothetical protein
MVSHPIADAARELQMQPHRRGGAAARRRSRLCVIFASAHPGDTECAVRYVIEALKMFAGDARMIVGVVVLYVQGRLGPSSAKPAPPARGA